MAVGNYHAINQALNEQLTLDFEPQAPANKEKYYRDTIDQQKEHIASLVEQLRDQQIPFDETANFRDFMVWLCGYTGHAEPPSQADWDNLCDKVKHVAAKFALEVRRRDRDRLREYTATPPRSAMSGHATVSTSTAPYTSTTTFITK